MTLRLTAPAYIWAAMRRSLMLTADSMTPPELNNAKRVQIECQMLDLLVRGMWQVLLTSAVIGPLLVAWMTMRHIGTIKAVAFALLLLILSAERVFLLRWIERERAKNDDSPRRWARAIAWRASLGSCIIVVWFHFVVKADSDILVSQMLALVTILAAGAAAQFANWPPVMWAVVTPLLIGMAVQLAVLGDPERLVEAVFCFVLWIVVTAASLRSARTLHNEALIRLYNEKLVRDLEEKRKQAEAARAAQSRFFAAASHDLRQPLQAMALYLSVLQPDANHADTTETMEKTDSLARVHECMKALDHLLESVLDLSRIDSGQLTPMPQSFALQPLLERLANMYEAMAQQKGLQLRVHATNAWVHSDPALLERALSNLLANAIRYTYRGGVLLGARRAAQGQQVHLCIFDTGIGIAAHEQEAIYDEFVQLNNPERDPAQGHGLGLPTVKRIAGLLGHRLSLQSREGCGTVFTLDIPVAQPDKSSTPDPAHHAPTQLHGRVLVVEDHPLVRDALVQLLCDWGLEVHTAENAETALAAMTKTRFDIVLSDWRLPGAQDGLAVLREARTRLPQLRLGLLITGEDTQVLQQMEHAVEFPVLRKPLKPLRLRALLVSSLCIKPRDLHSSNN